MSDARTFFGGELRRVANASAVSMPAAERSEEGNAQMTGSRWHALGRPTKIVVRIVRRSIEWFGGGHSYT